MARRVGVAVGTLMHWGRWCAARGDIAQAAALLRFVIDHPAVEGPDRAVAERSLAALAKALDTDARSAADAQARQTTVEELSAALVEAAASA